MNSQQPTVIINQPTVVTTVVQQFRSNPVQTNCPSCHAQVVTSITYDTGTFAWLLCVIICLVG
jgi:lipopolysaccharide-induced tumor necrosis factor-alpha factor